MQNDNFRNISKYLATLIAGRQYECSGPAGGAALERLDSSAQPAPGQGQSNPATRLGGRHEAAQGGHAHIRALSCLGPLRPRDVR